MAIKLIAVVLIVVGIAMFFSGRHLASHFYNKKVVAYEVVEITSNRIVNDIIRINLDHGKGISPKEEAEIKLNSIDALINILERNGYKIDDKKNRGEVSKND